jgi:transcriptional regulator with XRE-family HTH domain
MNDWITLDELLRKYPVDAKRLPKAMRAAQAGIDGVKLAELRQAKKLSQTHMAKKLKIDQSNISRIERGGFDKVEVRTLRRYVEALGGELEIRVKIDEVSQRLIDSEYEKKLVRRLARGEKSKSMVKKKPRSSLKGKTAPRAKSVAKRRRGKAEKARVGAARGR